MTTRYWPAALLLVTACNNPKSDLEMDTMVACEMAIKRNLMSSSSYEPEPKWLYVKQGADGMVGRNYSATNGFGARIDSKYFCQFDPVTASVVYLMVEEPTGTRFLIAK